MKTRTTNVSMYFFDIFFLTFDRPIVALCCALHDCSHQTMCLYETINNLYFQRFISHWIVDAVHWRREKCKWALACVSSEFIIRKIIERFEPLNRSEVHTCPLHIWRNRVQHNAQLHSIVADTIAQPAPSHTHTLSRHPKRCVHRLKQPTAFRKHKTHSSAFAIKFYCVQIK